MTDLRHRVCKVCGNSALLVCDFAADGSLQVFWWCCLCRNYADPHAPFESKTVIKKLFGDVALPRIIRSSIPRDEHICAVAGCLRCDTQRHHFAPKNKFGARADDWPTAWLCSIHHDEWHDKIEGRQILRVNGLAFAIAETLDEYGSIIAAPGR